MLKTYGQTIVKGKSVLLMGSSSTNSAAKGKGPNSKFKKKKAKGGPKPQALKPKGGVQKKPKVQKDACLYCKQKGHWKRDCEKAKADGVVTHGASSSNNKGILVIEINMSTNNSDCWVLDTACGSHICNNVQGLTDSRKVRPGEINLRVGNGAKVAAERVGTYKLDLPSGFSLQLNNCYFVPSIVRNIISVPMLDVEGFSFRFANRNCYIMHDDMTFGIAPLLNGLYILECRHNIFHIQNKRPKLGNPTNPTYLWHCRLGHINETRIARLNKLDYLDPFDFESYGECESCLKGKMTNKPLQGKGIRANKVLELVHTDVCGPFPTQARGGYSYFITFTDDFSRFGHVYLMKHKSEAFEKIGRASCRERVYVLV